MLVKRGLSSIVATVLIVLLAMVAVAITASFITPLIRSPETQIQMSMACQGISLEVVSAVYDITGSNPTPPLNVMVKRNQGSGNITKIRFLLDSQIYTFDDENAIDLSEYNSKQFIRSDASPSSPYYIDIGDSKEHKIKVAPVIMINGKEFVCSDAVSAPKVITKLT